MLQPQPRVEFFCFFLGGPAHNLLDLKQGGPAQYPEARKLSRKLFVDKLNFFLELWD